MKHVRTLFASALVVFASAANAAEIKRYAGEDGSTVISITGRLVDGDDRRFSLLTFGVEKATVALDSEGGRALVAIAIGKELRRNRYATKVDQNKTCASACGLIWLAGQTRMAYPSSYVGFHSVFTFEPHGPAVSEYGNSLVNNYLRGLGFSSDVVEFATSEQPRSMKWMSTRDAMRLGVSVDLRPE